MKRRLAYAGAAVAAVFATMALTAPSASAGELDWHLTGASTDEVDWG